MGHFDSSYSIDKAGVIGLCTSRGFDAETANDLSPDYCKILITQDYGLEDPTINDYSGKKYGGFLEDKLFVHELTHAMFFAGVSNIKGMYGGYSYDNTSITRGPILLNNKNVWFNFKASSSVPTWFSEGIAELVHGIDQERKSNLKAYAKSAANTLKSVFNGSTSSSTAPYTVGFMALRYFAKKVSEATKVKFSS